MIFPTILHISAEIVHFIIVTLFYVLIKSEKKRQNNEILDSEQVQLMDISDIVLLLFDKSGSGQESSVMKNTYRQYLHVNYLYINHSDKSKDLQSNHNLNWKKKYQRLMCLKSNCRDSMIWIEKKVLLPFSRFYNTSKSVSQITNHERITTWKKEKKQRPVCCGDWLRDLVHGIRLRTEGQLWDWPTKDLRHENWP